MSTTTNIGLFKHDNPATNTDEFNVDKALNENWDKLDTAIGTDRERITTLETDNTTNKQEILDIKAKDTEQDKYISELEAENTRLKEDLNGLPKGQVSGETIDLTDSAEMRCELKISGNSVQDGEPTPDTPVEVECCGDNGNMFDKDNVNILNNMFLNTTNKNIVTYSKRKCFYLEIEDNTMYTINGNYHSYGTTEEIPSINSNLINVGWTTPATFISSSNVKYLVVYYLNENDILTEQEILDSIKIEKGPTASPYSPYGQGCINEVICNKNIFDKNNEKLVDISSSGIKRYGIRIKAPNQYITFSSKMKQSNTYITYKLIKNGEYGQYIQFQNNKTIYVEDEIVFYNGSENNKLSSIADDIQIEYGQLTPYEEHKSQTYTIPTQQPMRSVGDTRDTFIKKNGKWYERHYVSRKIFDGTEDWKLYGANASTYRRFGLAITGDIPKTIKILSDGNKFGKGVCSHFKVDMDYRTTDLIEFIQIGSPSWYIGITDFNSKWADIEILKTYLSNQYNAGTPVYVDYILETPLDIECTEEQNAILDQIEKEAKTYKNVTHIYSTDNVSPNVEITYKKDIDTMISNIEQAILSQGGNI